MDAEPENQRTEKFRLTFDGIVDKNPRLKIRMDLLVDQCSHEPRSYKFYTRKRRIIGEGKLGIL